MEANQLPTKVGPYYWCESEGDEFQLVRVELHLYNRNPDVVHLSCYSGKEMRMLPIKDMQGEWLPIPTADELVELQSAKKMVDEKHDGWAIFQRGEFCLSVPTQNYVIRLIEKITGCPWMTLSSEANYTCEPVTIIRKEKP